jgi:two-component system cell cycle sensor histidine kinase/response regulator CckA
MQHTAPDDLSSSESNLSASAILRFAPISVLLVEDNPGDMLLFKEALRQANNLPFKLTHAGRLSAALKELEERVFDIAVMDLSLPDAQGFEGIRKVMRDFPNLPVVVLTGLADDAAGIEAVQMGTQDYLVKGQFDGSSLSRAIRYAIERKQVYKALEESNEKLQRAKNLEDIGRLAGGIAHDFNNMLTVINLSVEAISESINHQSPIHPDVVQIKSAATRAAELTNQLLAYGRRQILRPGSLNVNSVVNSMDGAIRQILGDDIVCGLQLRATQTQVYMDRTQLEQVIFNLALNARDSMPKGGTLLIETSNVIRGDPAEPWLMLSISDTGVGMQQETAARVFEPFFTTKNMARGSGLGLATVYGMVHQSGGDIELQTRPGEGTRFDVFLPIRDHR